MKRPASINAFVANLKKQFSGTLIGAIGYGSFFGGKTGGKDLDFIVILSKRGTRDLQKIRDAFKSTSAPFPLHSQVIYKNEILQDGNFYSINTCGSFFLHIVRRGHILYGKNLLKNISLPNRIVEQISLLQKTQQYLFEIRNIYINHDKNLSTDILKKAQKRIKSSFIDIELFYQEKPEKALPASLYARAHKITKSEPTPKLLLQICKVLADVHTEFIMHLQKTYGLSISE